MFLGQKSGNATNGRDDLRGGTLLQGYVQERQCVFVILQSGLELGQVFAELLYGLQGVQSLVTSEKKSVDARACNKDVCHVGRKSCRCSDFTTTTAFGTKLSFITIRCKVISLNQGFYSTILHVGMCQRQRNFLSNLFRVNYSSYLKRVNEKRARSKFGRKNHAGQYDKKHGKTIKPLRKH